MENHSVFSLVKSMTEKEKSFFKRSNREEFEKGTSAYILLYTLFEKAKGFDHPSAVNSLKKSGVRAKAADVYDYLGQRILKTLQEYYADKSPDQRTEGLIRDAFILGAKGITREAEKKIEKAKKIAREQELYIYFPAITNLELSLLFRGGYGFPSGSKLESVKKEWEEAAVPKICEGVSSWIFQMEFYRKTEKYGEMIRTEKERGELEEFLKSPLLSSPGKNTLTYSQGVQKLMAGTIYTMLGKWKEAVAERESYVALLESLPPQHRERQTNYTTALIALLNLITLEGKIDKMPPILEKLEEILNAYVKREQKGSVFGDIQSHYYNYALLFHYFSGNLAGGIALSKKFQEDYKKFYSLMPQKTLANIYLVISTIYFADRQYSPSLQWINRIVETPGAKTFENTYCFALLFRLIIHFEMGNQDLIEYQVLSVYRYLLKRKRVFGLEEAVLRFIRNRVPKIRTPREQIDAFRELREYFAILLKDPIEKQGFSEFEFHLWLDSKITGESFSALLKKEYSGK